MAKKNRKQANSLKIPKLILIIAAFLELISSKLTTLFVAKLFTTPIKHDTPKREFEMLVKSRVTPLEIPKINKKVVVYHYGNGNRKVLLVHGWSGRGTQLFKMADALINQGYSIISFDAPAHGKSPGNSTIMLEFIETILEIDRQYGSFDLAIGHSLGGMTLLNAINQSFKISKLIVIGSGDRVEDIIKNFVAQLQLKSSQADLLKIYFEKKYGKKMDLFSSSLNAKTITIPVLIIHDEHDEEVPVSCAYNILNHLREGSMIITQNLGHRKILGDELVIQDILKFVL